MPAFSICFYQIFLQVSTNHLFLTGMMGFEEQECKRMLIAHPELYMQKFEDYLQEQCWVNSFDGMIL